jgi:hypothetical protein
MDELGDRPDDRPAAQGSTHRRSAARSFPVARRQRDSRRAIQEREARLQVKRNGNVQLMPCSDKHAFNDHAEPPE